MAPNKRKMLEAARKYAQKGAQERALKEYEQLLKLDPRDAKLRLEIADVHRRWGQVDEAAAAYRRVAEQYTAEGFDARAVAVYKQIQSLDPKGHAACEPLAELYQRMGLASEAISALQAAADGHAREGNKRHALDLLRRMVSLDSSNTTNRIKVADLLRQENMLEESAAEYESVCEELERQGETEATGRVLERLLELAPDRADVLARLSRNLLVRGKPDEAEAPARRASERDPQEIQHHELLADIYRAQKRDDKLVDVYRKIAELYRQRGDDEQARDIMQRFVPMEAFEAPASVLEESPFGAESLEFDDPGGGRELLRDEEFLDDSDPITHRPAAKPEPRPPAGGAPARRPVVPPSPPTRVAPSPPAQVSSAEETVFELGAEEGSRILGDPEALLAEASVYLRYGKRGQAIENLQAILARSPHHRGALEKLGDAYADDGDTAGAVAAWLRAGEIARDEGDLEAMSLLRDRVAALDAGAASTLESEDEAPDCEEEFIDLPGEDEPSVSAPALADDLEASAEDIEIDLDGIADEEAQVEAPAPSPAETRPALASDAEEELEIEIDLDADDPVDGGIGVAEESEPALAAAPEQDSGGESASHPERVAEDLEEAEFYLQQGLCEEARGLFERVLAASPGHPIALVRLGELAAAAGESPDAPGSGQAVPERSLTPVAPPTPRGSAEETDPDPDGAWLAEDEDPFLDREEESDADAVGSPGVEVDADRDRGASLGDSGPSLEVGEAGAPEHEVRDAASAPGSDGDFDLAAELSAALEDAVPTGPAAAASDEGFQAVFGAFKRGVEESLGSGDYEAHYDLGIAYREMGLLDDAAAEFRNAMQSPARRIDGLHMLGLCALEQGRSEEAIDLLAHALGAPDVAQEQELAIRFELGRAYEQAGDLQKARTAWEKVAAVDPDFCEVSELLASLAAREAAPTPQLESFGDLIAEAQASTAPDGANDHESFDDLLEEARADLDSDDDASGSGSGASTAETPAEPRPKTRRRKISFV